MTLTAATETGTAAGHPDGDQASLVDVVVVGAGFSGLYLIKRLKDAGFSVRAFDEAADVGGTWYWNRYPGARCDIATTDYTYSFDPELERAWTWSEKYATQPEILAYLGFVADRYDLRRHISFATKVEAARWDDVSRRWHLLTSSGEQVSCQFYVMATGCLSLPKVPDIPGVERFRGETYLTGRWPHHKVDFVGKRVAVIGTGSSGIQCIPEIAKEAASLVVFQRTANFSAPAHNGPPPPARLAALQADREAYRHAARWSRGGVPTEPATLSALAATESQRRERFEAAWEAGELFAILNVFSDQGTDLAANQVVAEMIREKIRSVVKDPETAEALCPYDHPFGTKRPCLDSGYYETFNLPHVRLVDLRKHPISAVTEVGMDTVDESFEFDAIVFATGFDAMTGPLLAPDVRGRDGVSLRSSWQDRPHTYLGLTTVGFPNFFTVTGPGSPSVLSNMAVSIEQHVEWISDLLVHMRSEGFETVEPTPAAQEGWDRHCDDCAALTLHPLANSWYMGANVPGKPRVLYPYIGGVDFYRKAAQKVAEEGYLGFRFEGPGKTVCNDGVVRRLAPDVEMMLELMASLGLPPLDSLDPAGARELMAATAALRPPGPEVARVVDSVMDATAGRLPYRLYVPEGTGPHPLIVYFHGGGWVLGNLDSDDPFCRDLCSQVGAAVVSVNYRHAPEHRYPTAAEDAWEALGWAAAHASELGADPERLVVAGWSAGGNLAAVVAQRSRDQGGPRLAGQVLVTPVVDCDLERDSYKRNGDGYVLTTALMRWFWDHYADPAVREDPTASPLRGRLAGAAPAVVVTAEFDPLCDEGVEYAKRLGEAGVAVTHIPARGQVHTSLTMVGQIISSAAIRRSLADAVRELVS